MKALLLESPKNLKRIEIEPPGEPGPGEALVRVHRIGICGTDISGYLGKMPFFSYPRIPGHELGVEVLEVGDGRDQRQARRSLLGRALHQRPELLRQPPRTPELLREAPSRWASTATAGCGPQFLLPARKLHVSTKLAFDQLALVETLAIGCHAVDRAGTAARRIVPGHRRRADRPRRRWNSSS